MAARNPSHARRPADEDIASAARTMRRYYGERAAQLMERRSQRYAAEGDRGSAAFWHQVAQAVGDIAASKAAD
jgi:hypothetical protein